MANTLYPQLESFSLYSSGASIGDTTLVLTTFLSIDGVQLAMSDFGDKGFMTLEPGAGSNEEQISFSGVTANSNGTTTLTGVKTVLHLSPYTETSGLAKPHSGGSKAVVAVTSGLLNQFTNKGNSETITGAWVYPNGANTPTLGTSYVAPTISWQMASKGYVDSVAVAGAPNADTTTKGIVEIATGAELAAGTGTGGTGAVIVPAGSSFTGTPAGAGDVNKVPTLNSSGTIPQGFLDSARTIGAVYSFTANNAQITSDPDSANDAVRYSYLTSYVSAAAVENIFGDASDGNVTISSPTTLTRDMFYDTLTLSGANDITTAGFKIFCKTGLVRNAASTSVIKNNGGNATNGGAGSSGSGGTAGAAGAAAGFGTLPSPGTAAAGAVGVTGNTNGNNGSAGGTVAESLIATGTLSAGAGGNAQNVAYGLHTGGTAGTAATTTLTAAMPRSYGQAVSLCVCKDSTVTIIRAGAGAPGGGSGGTSGGSTGSGGGGGGGASGGIVFVAAKTITDSGSGTMFSATGGNGGNGGNGFASAADTAAAGGGGGSGGDGGAIIRITNSITGTAATAVTAGTGGSAGTGQVVTTGTLPVLPGAGSAGRAGVVLDITV